MLLTVLFVLLQMFKSGGKCLNRISPSMIQHLCSLSIYHCEHMRFCVYWKFSTISQFFLSLDKHSKTSVRGHLIKINISKTVKLFYF